MNQSTNFLKHCVYYHGALGNRYNPLPGVRLMSALESVSPAPANIDRIIAKIEQSARKLALMWTAGDLAEAAEHEFFSATFQDAPALSGEDAVILHYHLEAFVLFAGSALDISAGAFGELLPNPFPVQRRREAPSAATGC